MNVLLVAPKFYEFDSEIKKRIDEVVDQCLLLPEKPTFNITLLQLIIQKLPTKLYTYIFDRYTNKVQHSKIHPDVVLVIRGEHWSVKNLVKLKYRFITSKFLMYQWDSSKNLPFLEEQLKFFDSVYTFDPSDAAKYGITTKPLFYKERWRSEALRQTAVPIRHKVAFIGTDHTDRHEFIQSFKKLNGFSDSEFFCHLFRSRWSFYFNKYIKRSGQFISKPYDFCPHPLGESDSIEEFLSSHAILDINPVDQVGLSARTFEALALNKKLITTNKNISGYDFFDPRNILIIDRQNPVVPQDFFATAYVPPSADIIAKYSSSAWVKDFLEQ